MSEQRCLTLKEFAKLKGMSLSTLRRRLIDGLPHFQPGGPGTLQLVPIDALEQLEAAKIRAAQVSQIDKKPVTEQRLPGPIPPWMREEV